MLSVNRTYFVDVNSSLEIELLQKSFTIQQDPLQVSVWTQWTSTSNHRRYMTTMTVTFPDMRCCGDDGVRYMTSIDFKLQQLLVPTMRLSGHRWHSSGGCLAGEVTVHRHVVRWGDRVVPSKDRGIEGHHGWFISSSWWFCCSRWIEKPRFTKKGKT